MIGLTNSKNYKDIADAIRAKGVSGDFKPSEMAAAIRSIGGGDTLLKYTSDMGYISSGTVIENKISNLLALATSIGKDIEIKFKIGSANYDDWILTFYYGDYMRIGPNSSNGKLYLKESGGASQIIDCDKTKEYTIIIHTATKKFDIIQEGSIIQTIDYWAESMVPFTKIDGATSIYANQNWLEYLNVYYTAGTERRGRCDRIVCGSSDGNGLVDLRHTLLIVGCLNTHADSKHHCQECGSY